MRDLSRRDVHIASESAALALVLPLAIYAAATPRLPVWARVGFGVVAVIDSALLASNLARNGKRKPQ